MQQPPPYSQQYFLPRRKQRVFDPGAMSRGDWWTVVAYILFFVLGGASLIGLIPGYFSAFDTQEQALFGINLILYTTFFIVAMVQCGAHFFESFKTMKYYPWAKWLMLPGGWLLTIFFSAIVTTLFGGPQVSANQEALQGMTTAVPLPMMFVVTAVFGPFVEEYLFRHLLIGKLSRKLNIWVCAVISTIVFASIHFLNGGGIASITQILPYLMLGVLMSLAYILSGKSLAYAYLLHFINNAMALLMLYLVYPLLPTGV